MPCLMQKHIQVHIPKPWQISAASSFAKKELHEFW